MFQIKKLTDTFRGLLSGLDDFLAYVVSAVTFFLLLVAAPLKKDAKRKE